MTHKNSTPLLLVKHVGCHKKTYLIPGWTWADKLLLTSIEFQDGVDIICTPGPGDVYRFSISLPEPERETFASRSLGRAADKKRYSVRADTVSNKFKTVRGRTILFYTFFNAIPKMPDQIL